MGETSNAYEERGMFKIVAKKKNNGKENLVWKPGKSTEINIKMDKR